MTETTALGAAYLAGLGAGIFKDTKDIAAHWALDRRFTPRMKKPERDRLYQGWRQAVARVRIIAAMNAIPSLKGQSCSAEEWQARVDLAATYRLVAMHGWDDMIFTHISARVPGPEHHFLINPYGLLFEEITASSLVKIDLDGNKLQDTRISGEPCRLCHSQRPAYDTARMSAASFTCTPPTASRWRRRREGLLPLDQHAMMMLGDLAYHDYEGIAAGAG